MANTKKYISLDKLGLYDEKIKGVIDAGDAKALKDAKDYADTLAVNYDEAGAAATVQGELDKEVARATAAEQANAAAAKKAQDEVDALELVVDGKAEQSALDTLSGLVGTLPEGTTATSVVDYVNVKTAGIATDAALEELNGQVSGLQTTVQGIKNDYLKGADKTELSDAITAEADRAAGVEAGLKSRIDTIADDYLKESDKEALSGAIDTEKSRAEGVEAGLRTDVNAIKEDYLTSLDREALQTQINTIMDNPDTANVIDSITEFTKYIADHGEIAEGFRTDIDKNKDDIAANAKAIADQATSDAATYATKTELATEKKALQDEIDADVSVVSGKVTTLEGVVSGKADQSALDTIAQELRGADTTIKGRLDVLEAAIGESGSVADDIETAKQEAIDAAAGDATTKANTAKSEAIAHANSLNTEMNTRVAALEEIDHDHSNKSVLDGITSEKVGDWDVAATNAHTHTNRNVLDGITSAKVTAWDSAESNAKSHATDLNTAMNTRVAALETWHNNFIEASEEDINGLFS